MISSNPVHTLLVIIYSMDEKRLCGLLVVDSQHMIDLSCLALPSNEKCSGAQ